MKRKDSVQRVQTAFDETEGVTPIVGRAALKYVLPVIKAWYSKVPWWKKVFVTVGTLINGLEWFLEEYGDGSEDE